MSLNISRHSIFLTVIILIECAFLLSAQTQGNHQCSTKEFRQKLNHSSAPCGDHFQQRYVICQEHWTAGGPLLFYTGSEANIMVFLNNSGFVFEMAAELGAMVVFAEHRYYGESRHYLNSHPTAQEMRYLTTENALIDFEGLIRSLRANISGLAHSSVVTIGGSYGGMLAAWMRMKYPDLIKGALASSAPIMFLDDSMPCNLVAKATTAIYRAVSPVCADAIHRSYTAVDNVPWDWLIDTLKICRPFAGEFKLKNWLKLTWEFLAMANYPVPTTLIMPLPEWPVKVACSHLSDPDLMSTNRTLLAAIAQAIGVFHNYTGASGACLNLDNDLYPDWPETQWDHQVRNDLRAVSCSDGVEEMSFNHSLVWKLEASPLFQRFGGSEMRNHSNIIFSNGMLDPLLDGGIRQGKPAQNITVIDIEGAAHHADLLGSSPSDPVTLREARKEEIRIIRGWLT